MKKYLIFFTLIVQFTFSQQYKVVYNEFRNNQPVNSNNKIVVIANNTATLLTQSNFNNANLPKQQIYYNPKNQWLTLVAYLKNEVISTIDSVSVSKQQFTITNETDIILGYKTTKASISINSNIINIWFTNDLALNIAPNTIGLGLGTVLRYSRNNDYVIEASSISEEKKHTEIINIPNVNNAIDALTFSDKVAKDRYITIPVFKNEIISYNSENISTDSIFKFGLGTIALRKIKIPEIKKGSLVFIDLKEQANGDAYDRTGSVFAILPSHKQTFLNALKYGINSVPKINVNNYEFHGMVSSEIYETSLEMMRFFTPFGIHHFNHIKQKNKEWHDWVDYRQDISEFAEVFSNKEIYIGVYIGNYDQNGHKVSANITIHPDNQNLMPTKYVLPIFNTTNLLEMGGQEYPTIWSDNQSLIVDFILNNDIKNAYLRYIATGHGGWENGDEFVPKTHQILLNDVLTHKWLPWRVDCGSYRLFNPASGNFANGLSSSDLSRSNWCPGTVTNPIYIPLGDLKTGKHKLEVKIPQGNPEGNSFSYWNVSGVIIGE